MGHHYSASDRNKARRARNARNAAIRHALFGMGVAALVLVSGAAGIAFVYAFVSGF